MSSSVEPFPALTPVQELTAQPAPGSAALSAEQHEGRAGGGSKRRSRGSSLVQSFINSNPPLGMWQATGEVSSKFPTLPEIRNGEFSDEGWSQEGQLESRGGNPHEIHRRTAARRSSASTRTKNSATHRSPQQEFPPTLATPTEREGEGEGDAASEAKDASHTTTTTTTSNISQHGSRPSEKLLQVVLEQAPTTHSNGPDETGTYPNGYRFPKKHTWSQSMAIGLKAFWKFFLTPMGFLITIYGLNVVGWGAMIFFVLLEAVRPGMCVPTCSDPNSPRQIWIEIDSQVLNALFCVTGFGLIPWRFRDFYYLMKWRIGKNEIYHRKLAGIYRGWYRLPGSQDLPESIAPPPVYTKKHPQTEESPPPYDEVEIAVLEANSALPLPATSIPDPPLTGVRAQPTKSWNLDIIIWMYLWNTLIQVGLAGIMWGLNRFNRPSWTTGLLISLGCVTGIVAGIVVFIEGSKVKKAEGIPVQEYDVLESIEDFQKRKAKDDAKTSKKEQSHAVHEAHRQARTEKVKGGNWFVRH